MKTLAVRMEDEQHQQLTIMARLVELNITNAIREAIDQWIDSKRNDPKLQQRAQLALADIEQDATKQRAAIATLLNDNTAPKTSSDDGRKASQRRVKGGEPTNG